MPVFSTLDFILIGYFVAASVAIIILVFHFEKLKEQNNTTLKTNTSLSDRLRILQQQLAFITQKNQSDHNITTMESLFEQADSGIIILSHQLAFITINPYAEKLLHIKKTDVISHKFSDYVKIVDHQGAPRDAQLQSALHGVPSPLPLWVYAQVDDSLIPIIGEFTPIAIAGGTTQIAFHFIDGRTYFHESIKLADQVKELSSQLLSVTTQFNEQNRMTELSSKLMNRLNMSILVLDQSGKVIQMNPAAEQFFGTLKSELLGKFYKDILILKNQKDGIDFTPVETALGGLDAPLPKWTFISTRSGTKAVNGAAITISTQTEEKRTVLYFLDAQDAYQQETEEKAFFSSAAHDLRSPLTTVRAVTELLEASSQTMRPQQVKELLTGAKESTVHLIELVNNLLNVSRIDQNRITITKTVFDISHLVREIVESMQILAKEKHLYLEFEITDTGVPKIIADVSKTREIVTNVISNGIKYTQNGGVSVKLSYEDGTVAIRIADTGNGITPENRTLLFHKYQQVGASRGLSIAKSTGLGLYISKKFADMMGGTLTLESSEPERGSVFKIALPIAPNA